MYCYSKFPLKRKTTDAVGFDLCVDCSAASFHRIFSAPWCGKAALLQVGVTSDGSDNYIEFASGGFYRVPTGTYVELNHDISGDIRPRSSTTFKYGIRMEYGTIDPDYRGEIMLQFEVIGPNVKLKHGDSIAQLVLSNVSTELEILPSYEAFTELTSHTTRDNKGFGHTDER